MKKSDGDAMARLRDLIKSVGTQRAAAKQLKCSEVYLSDVVNGRRGFSDSMLGKLGLRRTVVAVEK